MDWADWHRAYDDPDSPLSHRRAAVQRQVRAALDRGARTVVSACAGDGTDVLGVLRADEAVTGRLVELDPVLAARARDRAPAGIEVVVDDAGRSDAYAGAVPADLVLLCGVFGNIGDDDVARTIAAVPQLAAHGATVVWTRGRHGAGRGPGDPGVDPRGDLTPRIRGWFAELGARELAFDHRDGEAWTVGAWRYDGQPEPLVPGQVWFRFGR